MAYVVQHHIKVVHISPGYGTYLSLDKEVITGAPIVALKLNLKMNQEAMDRVYIDHQCDTFMIDNALVYKFLSKVCKTVEQCSLTFTNVFLALTMWQGRSQR